LVGITHEATDFTLSINSGSLPLTKINARQGMVFASRIGRVPALERLTGQARPAARNWHQADQIGRASGGQLL